MSSGLQPDDVAVMAQVHVPPSVDEKKGDFVVESGSLSSADPSHAVVERGPDYPTEEEQQSLRRVSGKINLAIFLIAFVEFAERFSFYGSTVVFTNFIQQPLPAGSTTGASAPGEQSGALGKGQQASTGLGTFNQFWAYVTPLVGAWIADTYLGRYKTICWAVAVAIVGHVLLTASAAPSIIAHPNGAMALFAVAIVVMGAGTGAFKSNISPLIAEQMPQKQLRVIEKKGVRVIEDPAITASRIFMLFYFLINVGALVGQIGMVYAEKQHGFWLAFLLPTLVFLLCPLILFVGKKRYTHTPPSGSVLTTALKILFYAGRGKWFSWSKLTGPDFWESAKPSKIPAEERPAWMSNFDDAYVDEVRRGFKACTVFLFYPPYWLTYNQINNNLTSQAATMNTHGLPNDVLNNLDPFALLILIPVCDYLVYPALRKAGINFSPLKRIFAGFMTGALAMVAATVVQYYIYKKSPCGHYASTCDPVDINVWVQTPSYVLIALSEIFASITGLEYAYTKAPKSMRSLVMAIFLFQTALSSAIGEAFISLSADPLLIWNYGVFGVLAFIGGIAFWFSFRSLDKEDAKLNELVAGRINNFQDPDLAPAQNKISDKEHA